MLTSTASAFSALRSSIIRPSSKSSVYLDTHIVVWLYAGLLDKFTPKAKAGIDDNTVVISQFVRLELQYLYEIRRIKVKPDKIIGALAGEIDLRISECPLNNIIEEAPKINWTRDVFDRLLVAETMRDQSLSLITADKKIREKFIQALW